MEEITLDENSENNDNLIKNSIDINTNNLISEFGISTKIDYNIIKNNLSSQIESSTILLSTIIINSSNSISLCLNDKLSVFEKMLCNDTDYLYDTLKEVSVQLSAIKCILNETNNIIYYTITAKSDNQEQGIVSGGGTYKKGDIAQITAIPNDKYEFYRWNDNNTQNPRIFTVEQDVSLTGYFTKDDDYIIITFNANGGTIIGNNKYEILCNELLTNPPNDPEFTGYSFIGWFDDAESGNLIDLTTYRFQKSITLYAHYKEIKTQYKITLDANGGTCISDEIDITIGDSIGSIPNAYLKGYSFLGWYHLNDKNINAYTYSNFIPTSDIILTAYYTNSKYITITYDSNDVIEYVTIYFNAGSGGTCETSETTIIKGSHLTELPVCYPSFYGYKFNGWFTSETGGTQITLQTPFNDNATIYAQYSIVENKKDIEVPIKITYTFPNFDFTGNIPREYNPTNTCTTNIDSALNNSYMIWWLGKTTI